MEKINSENRYKFHTIVISDIHLGKRHSNIRKLIRFLKCCDFEHLIINGDLIDYWTIRMGGELNQDHMTLIKMLFEFADSGKKIAYICGNHDNFLRQIPGMYVNSAQNFMIQDECEYFGLDGKKYLIVHGDKFDSVVTKMERLSYFGDFMYNILLDANHKISLIKDFLNLKNTKTEISKILKGKFKETLLTLNSFEEEISNYARNKKFDGIICGHVHVPCIKNIKDIVYMNSGDWVDNSSALCEDFDGSWKLFEF